MKQPANFKSQREYVTPSRAQKIWGVVALVGLFACGLMIGIAWRGNSQSDATADVVQFTEAQCNEFARRIQNSIDMNRLDDLEKYQKIYAQSCGNHIVAEDAVVSETSEKTETCEKIERLLFRNLKPSDSEYPDAHTYNAELYRNVSQYGCPENAEKFKQLADDETAIAVALGGGMGATTNNTRTCEEIERALKSQLFEIHPRSDIEERLHNADIYSTMAERGCPENSEKYKELALRQIDVVSAVSDEEELIDNKESIVETYKKLQMQEAARNFLNKLDRLIKPTTDLIYEIGKVVNE